MKIENEVNFAILRKDFESKIHRTPSPALSCLIGCVYYLVIPTGYGAVVYPRMVRHYQDTMELALRYAVDGSWADLRSGTRSFHSVSLVITEKIELLGLNCIVRSTRAESELKLVHSDSFP